ncbi:hypothetical protein V8G54_029568 [Vigna mungo]|uniref:Putative plant transposon protein domain-containing protein n=1 Tax=Vigna mungo TaxID=3915 RepID=A0AAQ3MUI1_VIGMU
MASSSLSKRSKTVPSSERNASPSGWISDGEAREKCLGWKKIKDVVAQKSIDLSVFRNEGFVFPEKMSVQGLYTFVHMTGDYYPDLVQVFYNNVKAVDGNIHSRVKGVDVIIDNDAWLKVAGIRDEDEPGRQMFKDCMRYPGRYKKEKGFLFKWLNKEEKIVAHIIRHILIPRRGNLIKLTPVDIYLLNAIMLRIPTNWVVVFKWHILDVVVNDWCTLPYCVFISKILALNGVSLNGENKVTCTKANQIGKATMTCINLNKTALGWIFSDELDPTKGRENGRNNQEYVASSTSIEESEREEVDETSEEDSEELAPLRALGRRAETYDARGQFRRQAGVVSGRLTEATCVEGPRKRVAKCETMNSSAEGPKKGSQASCDLPF